MTRMATASTVYLAGGSGASAKPATSDTDAYALLGVTAVAVWSMVDFICTVVAWKAGWMHEANPIARPMLEAGAFGTLLVFRMGVVAAGTMILYSLRRHTSARFGLSACTGIHALLMGWWAVFWVIA